MADPEPFSPEESVTRFPCCYEPSIRDSALQNSCTRLNHFPGWCGGAGIENLDDLSGHDLVDFVAWRRGDIAPITLQKQLSTVRAALGFWADVEGIEDGLRKRVHMPELSDGVEVRDAHLSANRAESTPDYPDRYQYASCEHVTMALPWQTGMCRDTLRTLGVSDLHADDHAVELVHRSEADTALKSGARGERWVYFSPKWFEVVDEYAMTSRHGVAGDHSRRPPVTSKHDRLTGDTVYKWIGKLARLREYGDYLYDRERTTYDVAGSDGYPSRCPSS